MHYRDKIEVLQPPEVRKSPSIVQERHSVHRRTGNPDKTVRATGKEGGSRVARLGKSSSILGKAGEVDGEDSRKEEVVRGKMSNIGRL